MPNAGEIDYEKLVNDNNTAIGFLADKLDWHGFHPNGRPMFPATKPISEILAAAQEAVDAAVAYEREKCAALCDTLGDAEFAARAKQQNIGIATLVQRHYMACAKAIRERSKPKS